MKKGTLIDYKIKLNGIPFDWKTEITEWEPPFILQTHRLRSYKMWVHQHRFEDQ